jgi:hypothetical protein
MGLWIGMSAITIFEFLELFIDFTVLACSSVFKLTTDKTKKNKKLNKSSWMDPDVKKSDVSDSNILEADEKSSADDRTGSGKKNSFHNVDRRLRSRTSSLKSPTDSAKKNKNLNKSSLLGPNVKKSAGSDSSIREADENSSAYDTTGSGINNTFHNVDRRLRSRTSSLKSSTGSVRSGSESRNFVLTKRRIRPRSRLSHDADDLVNCLTGVETVSQNEVINSAVGKSSNRLSGLRHELHYV